MALSRQATIAYAGMGVVNPISLAALDRLLDVAGLPAGARAADIGCGNGVVSRHLCDAGFAVDALERDPDMAEIARARLETPGPAAGPGRARVVQGEIARLAESGPYDLVLAMGVTALAPGDPSPRGSLGVLSGQVRPGGWVLWGEPFLKRAPSDAFAAMLAPIAAYESHGGNVAAGEAAGLEIWSAEVGSEADWETFVWTNNVSTLRWLDAHPDDPQVPDVRTRLDFMRRLYLTEARDTLGFGAYLFRRPL